MLLLWALPLGILLGYLRGGRLANLARLELRGAGLVFVALVIQLLIFPLPLPGREGPLLALSKGATAALHLASYALLAAFVALNHKERCINCEGVEARLTFLGDVFYVPAWVPFANVFSLGDVLLAVGLIALLQAKMRGPRDATSAGESEASAG